VIKTRQAEDESNLIDIQLSNIDPVPVEQAPEEEEEAFDPEAYLK
jgi:hypothetical protein